MKKESRVSSVLIALVVAYFPIVCATAAATTDHASRPHMHKKHAKLKNPVSLSAESIEAGKTIFQKHCIACHVKGGVGPDLTDKQWIHGTSDGEMFYVISDGVPGTSMKGFNAELSEEMRWHLVNYIKSSGKKGTEGP
jgi:cytochrome c oxidase cbb3-type subunit 3